MAEAKQIQEILSEYHEDTHIILETDSSAAKANAERPGCGKMKHISVNYKYLQDAITTQEVWLRKVGTKNNVADGLTNTVNQHVLRNMLTTLKIELLETSKEQLFINLIVCKNNLMGAEDSDAGSSGRQSKYWTQEHRDGCQRKQEHREGLPRNKSIVKDFVKDCRENWHKSILKDCRENWHKNILKDCRENWHKNILTDCRENFAQEDRDVWPRKLAQEHLDGLPRKFCTRRS